MLILRDFFLLRTLRENILVSISRLGNNCRLGEPIWDARERTSSPRVKKGQNGCFLILLKSDLLKYLRAKFCRIYCTFEHAHALADEKLQRCLLPFFIISDYRSMFFENLFDDGCDACAFGFGKELPLLCDDFRLLVLFFRSE